MSIEEEAIVQSSSNRVARGAILLVFLGALLYFPFFDASELDDEEGRRALPAREMVESGDYVLPTLWGQPYLNKPPMFFWMIAASAQVTGGVNHASTRLPSVIATILSAVLLYVIGSRMRHPATGLIAGSMFLVTLAVIEKGAFGELEAPFTLALFACTACMYAASFGSRAAQIGIALFLCVALLIKGPPAFVFVIAAVLAIAIAQRDKRWLFSPKLWLSVLSATSLAGIWVYLLLDRPEVNGALATWGDQLSRSGGASLGKYIGDRKSLLLGALAGFFPASVILLMSPRASFKASYNEQPLIRFSVWIALFSLLFFLVMPGARTRYVHPVIPWIVLVASHQVASVLSNPAPIFAKRSARLAKFLAGIGLAVVGGAVWLQFKSIAGLSPFGWMGWTLISGLLVLAVYSWKWWSESISARTLWSSFGVLAILRLVQITEINPQGAERHGFRANAERIAEVLPDGETLYIHGAPHHKLLFYLGHKVVYVAKTREVPKGGYLLVLSKGLAELEREEALRGRQLLEVDKSPRVKLTLLQLEK